MSNNNYYRNPGFGNRARAAQAAQVKQFEKQIAQQVEAMARSKANMSDITFKRLFGNTREAAKHWWGGLSKAKKFGIGGGVGALGLGALGLGAYGLGAFDSPERELTVWEKLGLA